MAKRNLAPLAPTPGATVIPFPCPGIAAKSLNQLRATGARQANGDATWYAGFSAGIALALKVIPDLTKGY